MLTKRECEVIRHIYPAAYWAGIDAYREMLRLHETGEMADIAGNFEANLVQKIYAAIVVAQQQLEVS